MEEMSEPTIQYFMLGFGCIIVSSALKAFILHSFINAVIVSAGLFVMAQYLIYVGTRIKNALYVEKTAAISGHITHDQINDPTNIKLH